jgi:hypothetical protein
VPGNLRCSPDARLGEDLSKEVSAANGVTAVSSLLFVATGVLFVGIMAVVVFLGVVLGSLNPYLARHQARHRILQASRAPARAQRSAGHG